MYFTVLLLWRLALSVTAGAAFAGAFIVSVATGTDPDDYADGVLHWVAQRWG